MVNPIAVRAFKKKPRDDMDEYKTLTREEIEELRSKLKTKPPIWGKLRLHQKFGFLAGIRYKGLTFWYDTGTGKTVLALAIASYFFKRGTCQRALVLVPANTNRLEWRRQIKQHFKTAPAVVFSTKTTEKWEQLDATPEGSITVTTYTGLCAMLTRPVKKKGRRKKATEPDPKKVKRLAKVFDLIICDESDNIGGRQSLYWRLLRQLRKTAKGFFLLSGTPADDPEQLWSQMYLVDGGESLGKTLGMFRAVFYREQKNYFTGFNEYKFKPGLKGLLHKMMSHRALRVESDAADLPAVVPITRIVELDEEASAYYERAAKIIKERTGSPKEFRANFMRMRQISSGWLGYLDDETNSKAAVVFKSKPKMDALVDIVKSISKRDKILIMHDFRFSGHLIEVTLKSLGITFFSIRGDVKVADDALEAFERDKNIQCAIINRAGGYGLNLQIAKYQIFYESPLAFRHRKQMEARTERMGSKHKHIYRYDLLVRDTVDIKMRKAHERGSNFFKDVMNGRDKL